MLNLFQRLCAHAYCGGDFSYVADLEQARSAQDTLFTFLMIELSANEGCDSHEETLRRLAMACKNIEEVIAAIEQSEISGIDTAVVEQPASQPTHADDVGPANGTMVTMQEALDRMIDHAMHQASIDPSDHTRLGEAMDAVLKIARRGGFDGKATKTIEDMIVNHLGKD